MGLGLRPLVVFAFFPAVHWLHTVTAERTPGRPALTGEMEAVATLM